MKHSLFIAALAFLAVSCGQTSQKQAKNATQPAEVSNTSSAETKTLQVGDVKVTWIQDVASQQSPATFPDASASLIDSLGLQDGIPSSISTFLVETDSATILFDAGLGNAKSRLLPLLDSLGYQPEDIRYLYLTHLHGDHIGGMLNGEEPVFPNAAVYLSTPEYDGWMQMDDEKKAKVVQTMSIYEKQLHLFAFGDTLPGGAVAIDAVGHTPGHTVYQIGKLLIVGDIMHGVALQLVHTDICPTYDMDKKAAIESRQHILKYAKDNGMIMAGMHFPAPGFIQD